MKRRYRLFLFGVLLVLGVSFVFGQNLADSLGPIVRDILDIVKLYERYPYGVDFILYLIFFISLWKLAMSRTPWGENMKDSAVKSIYVILGIISAISVTLVSMQANFTLAQLGPLFSSLIFIFISLALYNMFGKSKLSLGTIFLTLWGIKNIMLPELFNILDDFLIFQIFNILLPIAGIIFIWQGLSELFGDTSGGDEKSGIFDKVGNKMKSWLPGDKKKPEEKKTESKEVDDLKKELQELHSLMEKTHTELRNFGLLDSQEIEKTTTIIDNIGLNLKAITKRETGLNNVVNLLLRNLDNFKKSIDQTDKNVWRGTRHLLRMARREEEHIPKINDILTKLKTFKDPNLQPIFSSVEELFHELDQLVARIQQLRKEFQEEHSETKKLDHELNETEKLLVQVIKSYQEKEISNKANPYPELIEHLKSLEAELNRFIKMLEISYNQIRDAHLVSKKIDEKVESISKSIGNFVAKTS